MTALWPRDIARLYGLAAPRPGAGQCIAIIAPRGGYLPADLALAAQNDRHDFPEVAEITVDGGRNIFGGGTIDDQEVALDLQVADPVAPPPSSSSISPTIPSKVWPTRCSKPCTTRRIGPAPSRSVGASPSSTGQHPLDVLNGALADAAARRNRHGGGR